MSRTDQGRPEGAAQAAFDGAAPSIPPRGTATAEHAARLAAAGQFAAGGLRVLACTPDKRPLRAWTPVRTMTPADALARYGDGSAWLGVLTGHVADVIDVDSPAAWDDLLTVAGGEPPPAYGIAATPSGGKHVYIPPLGRGNGTDLAGTRRAHGNIDYRGDGGYVIAPPSPGYRWLTPLDLARGGVSAAEWRAILAGLGARGADVGADDADVMSASADITSAVSTAADVPLTRGDRASADDADVADVRYGPSHIGGVSPWVAAKLAARVREVAACPQGRRNAELNAAAYDLGHYVPAWLDAAQVTAELTAAALAAGLTPGEIAATIASGLAAGQREPRDPPGSRGAEPVVSDSVPTPQAEAEAGGKPQPQSVASQLADLALGRYRLGVTAAGAPYAVRHGHLVARHLRGGSQSLRAELAAEYRRVAGRVPGAQALADAVTALEGLAQDAEPEELHLRVAEAEGAIWLDLGTPDERVIRLDAAGWEVTHTAPVLFRRSELTAAWPEPERGGALDELWRLVRVAEADRPLVVGWLVAAIMAPAIPHPILALFGEQGAGKSTASRLLVSLADPSPVPTRKPPRDVESWVTAASGSWVVAVDNMSSVPDWLSDAMCRAVTGDGDVRRQLYTDAQLAVYAFRRVLLLNGIDLGALRGDLAERLIAVTLDPIADGARQTERELTAAWRATYPRILGALLTLASQVIRDLPSVRIDRHPRMADYARILACVDQLTGSPGLARYAGQASELARDSLSADPFLGQVVAQLAGPWSGTAADLLAELADVPPPASHGWPRGARAVTTLLTRAAPALRRLGWRVARAGTDRAGAVQWQLTPPR